MPRMSQTKKGFTLIELVVISPLIILLIGALVGTIVYLTGSALRAQSRSQLQLDVVSALDLVEQDVKLSTNISPFGPANTLSMSSLATNKNPLSGDRQLIDSSTCSAVSGGIPVANAYNYSVKYSVVDNRLERQVTRSGTCAASLAVWQKATTEVLIKDADITVTVAKTNVGATNLNTVNYKITAKRSIAGETVEYTGTMHVRSLNSI